MKVKVPCANPIKKTQLQIAILVETLGQKTENNIIYHATIVINCSKYLLLFCNLSFVNKYYICGSVLFV